MHALIVVDHPNSQSLTHGVAKAIAEGLVETGLHSFELADLASEGFDPRFTLADIEVYHQRAPVPPDITVEQARLDRADALVLVFPIYWWSLPALLKGWIDRVFCNGWAFGYTPESGITKKLGHLPVHLVALGGSDAKTYEKRGYFTAFQTQIESGIFEYCGAPIASSHLLLDSESRDPKEHLETAAEIGRAVFESLPGNGEES